MKTRIAVSLVLLWFAASPAVGQFVDVWWHSPVKDRYVNFYVESKGDPPVEMTYVVEPDNPGPEFLANWNQEAATNHNLVLKDSKRSFPSGHWSAVWVPFQTNMAIDLGPGSGARWLWVKFKLSNRPKPKSREEELRIQQTENWDGHHIVVQLAPPTIAITSPTNVITSQPMIQLQGAVSSDFGRPLVYNVFDESGVSKSHGEGFVNDTYRDPANPAIATNYFTCYDVSLNPGTNRIVIEGLDRAGYSFTNSFVYVFTTVGDTNPPKFSIESPIPGHQLMGETFTIRGPCDDPTAAMTGEIRSQGEPRQIQGFAERNGYFWYEDIPLADGTNFVSLTARDAAGNLSKTNFFVIGEKDSDLTMDPVEPGLLWHEFIEITGKVKPANQTVWINGVQATVKPDGTWSASHVPVLSSPSGGTAIFNMTAIPADEVARKRNSARDLVSIQANLGTNTLTLNASSAACGVFQIHLTGTEGRSFVLEVSTNLTSWLPILTNSTPGTYFDYTDTNALEFPCRFFRVVPVK